MSKYQYKVQGVDYEVEIEEVEGNIAKVNVNGIPFEVELQQPINAAKHPTIVKPKVEAPKPVAAAPVAAAPVAVQPVPPQVQAMRRRLHCPVLSPVSMSKWVTLSPLVIPLLFWRL